MGYKSDFWRLIEEEEKKRNKKLDNIKIISNGVESGNSDDRYTNSFSDELSKESEFWSLIAEEEKKRNGRLSNIRYEGEEEEEEEDIAPLPSSSGRVHGGGGGSFGGGTTELDEINKEIAEIEDMLGNNDNFFEQVGNAFSGNDPSNWLKGIIDGIVGDGGSRKYWKDELEALKAKRDKLQSGSNEVESESGDSWFKSGAFSDGYQVGDAVHSVLGTVGHAAGEVAKGVIGGLEGISDLILSGAGEVAELFGADGVGRYLKNEADLDTASFIVDGILGEGFEKSSFIGQKGEMVPQAVGQVVGLGWVGKVGKIAGLGQKGVDALVTAYNFLGSTGSSVSEARNHEKQYATWVKENIKELDAMLDKGDITKEEYDQYKAELEATLESNSVSDREAWAYGVLNGSIQAGSEMLFGGLGKSINAIGLSRGISSLDDQFAKLATQKLSNHIVRNIAQGTIKAGGEGVEEAIAAYGSAFVKWLTYRSDEELSKLVEDENALEQAIVGFFASGISQTGSVTSSIKNKTDFITGLNASEEAVVKKEVENRIAEVEKDGKKLSNKDKNDIYDRVVKDLEKGYISIDTINKTLGGDSYKAYIDAMANEDAELSEYESLLKKKENDYTREDTLRFNDLQSRLDDIKNRTKSNELGRSMYESIFKNDTNGRLNLSYQDAARANEKFTVDLDSIDEKERETYKAAMESGAFNNSGRSHEAVSMMAKHAAKQGVKVNFTTEAKMLEEAKAKYNAEELKVINSAIKGGLLDNLSSTKRDAFIKSFAHGNAETEALLAKFSQDAYIAKYSNGSRNKSTGDITYKVGSQKGWRSTFGHEIMHSLEKTKHYDAMQKALFLYSIKKGDYDTRRADLAGTYDGVYDSDIETEIDFELAADLGGDYIFTDADFAEHLYNTDKNVFQRVFDEIKYWIKLATTGSEEARLLEKAKHNFEKALRSTFDGKTSTSAEGGTQWSMGNGDKSLDKYSQKQYNDFGWARHAEAITKNELDDLYSKLQEKSSLKKFMQSGYGEAIVEVNDDPHAKLGVNNVFAFVTGTKNNPTINKVVRFQVETATEMEVIKEHLYERGTFSYTYYSFLREEGLAREYRKKSAIDYNEYSQAARSGSGRGNSSEAYGVSGIEQDGRGTFEQTQPDDIAPIKEASSTDGVFFDGKNEVQHSLSEKEAQETNDTLKDVGLVLDSQSDTVSYSMSSLRDSFGITSDEDNNAIYGADYIKAREDYVNALAKSIAEDKGNPTQEEIEKADRYLDGLFLIHDMIAADQDRLDYEAAVDKSAWVSNSEYGGSIDFSTLCAKRRLFTGTFDAIQEALPDTVLNENDFLRIRDMLLKKELESPCSMCYVEGSRAKHGEYVAKFLQEYLATNPEWKPQIADFTSSTRLEQTRINHPEAYQAYQTAMNKLAQRKPKEASVRTDYKGEILVAFEDGSSVEIKNKNGGIRFNSFSDFEIIHALDAMQVITDMARVGLNGQAYTKVKEFAECFGNTGLKINLSLVAKDVDANGKLIYDEVNGMKYAEAMDIRSRYSENVGSVLVVFNEDQLKAALADPEIDYVLPFHRSQWKKSQYAMMGLPVKTKDYTQVQNDRIRNPKTGRPVKLSKLKQTTTYTNDITGETFVIKDNIMPNQYWDFSKSGRENAQRYLDYINANGMTPKFDSVLEKADGKWVLPEGAVGDGYYKLLIDFKMYDNDGWGAPQNPVIPEFNMPYIQQMLNDYKGGHKAFPVAHDVVNEFVEGKKNGQFSMSDADVAPTLYGDDVRGTDLMYRGDIAPVAEATENVQKAISDDYAPVIENEVLDSLTDEDAPPEYEMPYYDIQRDAVTVDDKSLKDISKRTSETLGLGKADQKILEGIIQNYSQNENLTRDDLYSELKKNFSVLEDYSTNDEVVQLKKHLKNMRLYVSDEVKLDFGSGADGYSRFLRSNFGKLKIVKDRASGVPVDSAYMELSDLYPSYFPEDIINPADQLRKISEMASMSAEEYYPMELSDAEIEAVTDMVYTDISDYMNEVRLSSATEASQAPISDLDAPMVEIKTEPENKVLSVKELYEQKKNNYRNTLAAYEVGKEKALANFSEAIGKKLDEYNGLKNKNTKRAHTLLQQIENLRLRRDNVQVDYANRIAKQQARLEAFESKDYSEFENKELAFRRKDHHKQIVDSTKTKFAEMGYDFDEVLRNAKDLSTIATVDNTPQRVMEKSLGYKEGQILSDLTVNKVAQNETEAIKWLNSFTNKKDGLLVQISKQYNIKPGSKESAAAQMYAEGFYVDKNNDIIQYGDAELAKDFPDAKVRENIKGLAKDQRIRQIYDETLAKINESRARNAYPEIPKLDNYFLHFRAMDDTFSRLGLPFNPNDIRAKDLPTDLNGVTADLKPGQPYFSSAMHRRGQRTSFDLLGGLEKYLSSAKNQIYHIDDIQTLRALRNYIADSYGQANGLEGLDALDEDIAQEKIKQVYGAHLSTFAKFLNEEANVIAGKTALIDRGLEGIVGRRAMTFMDTVNRQVGSNMVGYNVSSALTNLIAPVQAFAKTNKYDFIKGFAQTVSNKVNGIKGKSDGFAEESPVMIRRKGEERFHRTAWQKLSDPGYALMGAVDNFSTEIIARAKFNELTRKGMDSETAHVETDKWVSRLMGDRSLGQQPQLYNSKVLGLVTKFQLEVRNQLDSQFYDTIKEAEASTEDIQNGLERNAKKAAKIASTFFTLAVGQHIFGKVFESIAGYNPAFDIISVIAKAFGWDDEEESEDTVLDNIEQGFFELMGDMPYTSILEGGRIPISSALPIEQLYKGTDQYGNEKSRWETIKETLPYYLMPGGYGQLKKTTQGLGMFNDDHPISGSYTDSGKLRFPVEDTLEEMFKAGIFGQYASGNARDYFDNERAALDEKQTQEFIDSGISIQDYWDYREGLKGLTTINEKADYINSLDLPIDAKNLFINNIADREEDIDLSGMEGYEDFQEFDFAIKNPEKYDWLTENGITVAEFEAMDAETKEEYNYAFRYPEKYNFLKDNGVSYSDFVAFDDDTKDAYDWAFKNPDKFKVSKVITEDFGEFYSYKKAMSEFDAKDANGETVSGLKKQRVADYISSLDLEYGRKLLLFKSQYPTDDSYNKEIVEYLDSRSDVSYEEMVSILTSLGFRVNGSTVSWD